MGNNNECGCEGAKYGRSFMPGECGHLCGSADNTSLMTRLGLIEGDVLIFLERSSPVSLPQLMDDLKWPPCSVAMAVGSLLRQRMIRAAEENDEVFVELQCR